MKVKGLSLFLLFGAVTVILCDSTFVVDRKKNQIKTENTFKQTTSDDTSKENGERIVRKRGVLYNRSGLGSVSLINHGPRNYPTHPSFHKSAANAHLNYKRGLAAAVPMTASLAHAASYVIRPGGAVVQSYSANFPQYYFQSHSGLPPAAVPVGALTGSAIAYPGYSIPPAAHGSSVHPAHQAFALPQHHPILSHNFSPVVSIPTSLEPFHHQHNQQLLPASVQPATAPSSVVTNNAIYPGAVFPSTAVYRPQFDVPSQRPFYASQIPDSSSLNGNIPGIIPLLGSHHHKPDDSNADASPNRAEFAPSFSTTDTQQPWKPIFLHSPGTASTVPLNRPSITLLPPHHGSPEGPDSFALSQGSQHRPPQANNHGSVDLTNGDNYFNNLSADEIRQLLAQAQATFDSNLLKSGHRGYHY